MVDLIRIWLETDNQPAFRSAGWAYVLAEGRAVLGAAGGERTISADRAALAGLVDALRAAPSGANVEVRSSAPAVASIQRRLIAASDAAPTEDMELWAQILTALKSRTVRFTAAAPAPRTPTAFAVAWAELARNKAKTAGAFRWAIPKPNLAKAGVPA